MTDNNIVLWQGNNALTLSSSLSREVVLQSRFFLPSEVLVSHHGIVAMVIVDNKPGRRNISYVEDEWSGVGIDLDLVKYIHEDDPIRRCHFVDTEKGFSLIRAFILPSCIEKVFSRDQFLGEPFIDKCINDRTFDVEFDEERASFRSNPVREAVPLIKTFTASAWQMACLPELDTGNVDDVHVRTWLSFHGWFMFPHAVAQAQLSLVKALGNFDSLLERFASDTTRYVSSDLKQLTP